MWVYLNPNLSHVVWTVERFATQCLITGYLLPQAPLETFVAYEPRYLSIIQNAQNPKHSRTRKLWIRSCEAGPGSGERAGQHARLLVTRVSTWTSPSQRASSGHRLQRRLWVLSIPPQCFTLITAVKPKQVFYTYCLFLCLVFTSPALPHPQHIH